MGSPATSRETQLRYALAEGAAAGLWYALASGVFLTGFAASLHASDIAQGFLGGLPWLAAGAQFAAAWLIEMRGASRRRVTLGGLAASRGAFFLVVPAAFLLLPAHPRAVLGIFLALTTTAYFFHQFANLGWMGWMGELTPVSTRGTFFGTRNLIGSAFALGGTALGGQIAGQKSGYLILFTLAFGAGLASLGFLTRVREDPPAAAFPQDGFLRLLRTTLANRPFRRFLAFNSVWMAVVFIASPFMNVFLLQELKLSIAYVALTSAVSSGLGIATLRLWGSLCDRIGNRAVLLINLFFASIIPIAYITATPYNYYWLILGVEGLSGAAWAGITLAVSTHLLQISPKAGNAAYLSTFGALSGVITAAAPIAGGFLAHGLRNGSFPLFGLEMGHYKVLFLISLAGRLACFGLLLLSGKSRPST